MGGINLEIWFQQSNEVTVFLETSFVDSDEEMFYETYLFSLYAARHIANLGADDFAGSSLASVLLSIDTSNPLADVESRLEGEVHIGSPTRDRGGRKGFTAELRPEKRAFFNLKLHGFGLLGKGAGYYAPTSTLALLCWLLRRRKDDPTYQRALGATAENIGLAGTRGMINVASQSEIAMQAAGAAWGEAMERDVLPEGFELSPEALAAAEAHDIDFAEMLAGASARLAEAVEQIEAGDGNVVILPDEVCARACRTEVVMAAGLVDEEGGPIHRASQALSAAEETGDEMMVAAAEAHYDRELERLIVQHGLAPLVAELHSLLFTDDPEKALGL